MSLRLPPVQDKGTDRNFRDIESAINALPAQGVIAGRWRFTSSADAATLSLEYFDGKQWVTKDTWTS